MSRPTLEVADIVRAAGNRFWEHHGSHPAWQHRKVLDAIVRCRTERWAVIAIRFPGPSRIAPARRCRTCSADQRPWRASDRQWTWLQSLAEKKDVSPS